MSREAIAALHCECAAALEAYIAESRKTCTLLQAVESGPLPEKQLLDVQGQRLREYDAFERYNAIRVRLFSIARVGFTDSH
jgi:hypothetical protein